MISKEDLAARLAALIADQEWLLQVIREKQTELVRVASAPATPALFDINAAMADRAISGIDARCVETRSRDVLESIQKTHHVRITCDPRHAAQESNADGA